MNRREVIAGMASAAAMPVLVAMPVSAMSAADQAARLSPPTSLVWPTYEQVLASLLDAYESAFDWRPSEPSADFVFIELLAKTAFEGWRNIRALMEQTAPRGMQ